VAPSPSLSDLSSCVTFMLFTKKFTVSNDPLNSVIICGVWQLEILCMRDNSYRPSRVSLLDISAQPRRQAAPQLS
jgi:hypothetical protein